MEAMLFRKLETTASSSASDNEFMNLEAAHWGEPWTSGSGGVSTLQVSVWLAAERNDTVFEERSRYHRGDKENVKEEVEEFEMKKENIEEEKWMENKFKVEDVAEEDVTEEDLAKVMDKEDRRGKEKQRERWMREQRRNAKDPPPR